MHEMRPAFRSDIEANHAAPFVRCIDAKCGETKPFARLEADVQPHPEFDHTGRAKGTARQLVQLDCWVATMVSERIATVNKALMGILAAMNLLLRQEMRGRPTLILRDDIKSIKII